MRLPEVPNEPGPKPLAVVIGVSIYRRASWNLRTAATDAEALAATLERDHGYEVWLRRDAEVTRDALHALLGEPLRAAMVGRRQLLVFFAGHGLADDTVEDIAGHLVPHDGDEVLYPMRELVARLDALEAHHLLLVLDCCFAGAVHWARRRGLGSPPRMYRERYELYLASPAWQVLTSAAHDQLALDLVDGRPLGRREGPAEAAPRDARSVERSPFAKALLEGLAGAADTFPRRPDGTAGDGVITATELYLHVHEALSFPDDDVRADQTPSLWRMRPRDRGEYLFHHPTAPVDLDDAPALTRETCPYRGVEPFDERHRALFFGRTAIRAALLVHVTARALTIVVGASGTGKSSLVRAGLVPALRFAEPARAIVGPFRPGRDPLAALDAALAGTAPGPWCVVVDQLEEILTARDPDAPGAPAHEAFLTRLGALADAGHRVIATLRADLEPALWSGALRDRWADARFAITDLTQDELREAIERPAEARVLAFEPPALVDRLVNAVVGMPGGLPLLSFTLAHLYGEMLGRGAVDRQLRGADYDGPAAPGVPGGIPGALQRRAVAIRAGLDDEGRQVLHGVTLRMVAIATGVATRRRVPLRELVFGDPAVDLRCAAVLDALTTEELRLVVRGADADGAYVEPAHDAVVHGWLDVQATLRTPEGIATLLFHRRCTAAAADWLRDGCDPGLLWTEPRLGRALAELDRGPFRLDRDERAFLDESRRSDRQRRDAIERDERERRRRVAAAERAERAREARAEREARDRRETADRERITRRNRALWAAGAISVVLAAVAWYAFDRADAAERSAAAERAAAIRADDRVRLRAARSLRDTDATTAAAILADVSDPAHAAGWADLVRETLDRQPATVLVRGGFVDPGEGPTLLGATTDGRRLVLSLDGLRVVRIPGPWGEASPDGARVVIRDGDGWSLWAVAGPRRLATLSTSPDARVELSADGGLALVTSSGDDTAAPVLWDARAGVAIGSLTACGPVASATFVDATTVVTFDGVDRPRGAGRVCLWDADGMVRAVLDIGAASEVVITASPRGDRLVTSAAGLDGARTAILWDARTGDAIAHLIAPVEVQDGEIRFTPDGAHVVLAAGSRLRIVDAAQGVVRATVPAQARFTLTATGRHVITVPSADASGSSIAYALPAGAPVPLWLGRRPEPAPTGDVLAFVDGGAAMVVSLAEARVLALLPGEEPIFSSDGSVVSTYDRDHDELHAFDVAAGARMPTLTASQRPLAEGDRVADLARALSPDGRVLATSVHGEELVRVRELATGIEVQVLRTGERFVGLSFSPAGGLVVSAGNTIWIWARPFATARRGLALDTSPDGRHAIILVEPDVLELVRLDDGASLGRYRGYGLNAGFSPDGRWFAAISKTDALVVDLLAGEASHVADCRWSEGADDPAFTWSKSRVVVSDPSEAGCLIDLPGARVLTALPPLDWAWFSPDGAHLLAAPTNGPVALRRAADGAVLTTVGETSSDSGDFSPSGDRFVVGPTGAPISICAVAPPHACRPVAGTEGARSLVFADEHRVVATYFRGDVWLVDADHARVSSTIPRAGTCHGCPSRAGPAGPWRIGVVAADPPRLALLSDEGLGLYDTHSGEAVPTLCVARAANPDLLTLVRGGRRLVTNDCLIDLATGRMLLRWDRRLSRAELAPDGGHLVLPGDDGQTLAIHETETGAEVGRIDRGGPAQLGGFVGRGDRLFEHGAGGLRVWPVPPGPEPEATVALAAPSNDGVAVAATGARMLYAADGRIVHVPLTLAELQRQMAHETRACLSAAQRRALLEEDATTAAARARSCPD